MEEGRMEGSLGENRIYKDLKGREGDCRALVAVLSLSGVQLFVTLWTAALQTPLSVGFPKQEYGSRLPFPPPGDFLNPGIKPTSPASAGRFSTTEPPAMEGSGTHSAQEAQGGHR